MTAALTAETFDLLVVGGGAYGAALAEHASELGYSVALIERDDFASGASSNSLKILHGGLRYLQQLDFKRMRDSIRARRDWLQLAPQFTRPLACAIATHGLGTRNRLAFAAALSLNEWVSHDRNEGVATAAQLPPAHLLSADEFAAATAGVRATNGAGGALWWDALALDTERLVFELLARAADKGAVLANYVEAVRFIDHSGAIQGVLARDVETAHEFEVRAHRVMCMIGAAATPLFDTLPSLRAIVNRPQCHALNLVVDKQLPTQTALALPVVPGAARRDLKGDLFFVPWRGRTMIGTHYVMHDERQSIEAQRRTAVLDFIDIVRATAPQFRVEPSDVTFVHWGSLPVHERWRPGQGIWLSSEAAIFDGQRVANVAGLWLIVGPKFTTAMSTAQTAAPRVLRGLDPKRSPARRSTVHIDELRKMDDAQSAIEKAQLASRSLFARRLDDVLLRRTGLGSAGHPGQNLIRECVSGMAQALDWTPAKQSSEIAAVEQLYRDRHQVAA